MWTPAATRSAARGVDAPSWRPSGAGMGLARREHARHLPAERVEVVRLAAGNQHVRTVLVDVHLLVDPRAARVADVGLEARPRREGAALDHPGLHQRPGRVA